MSTFRTNGDENNNIEIQIDNNQDDALNNTRTNELLNV